MLTDLIIILLLLGFIGASAKDGFVHALGRLVGAVVGYYAARLWSGSLAPIVDWVLPTSWANFVAFLMIFLFVNRLFGFIVRLADGAWSILSAIPFLKTINKLLGGVIGLGEGVVILGGAIVMALAFHVDSRLTAVLQASKVATALSTGFQEVLVRLL